MIISPYPIKNKLFMHFPTSQKAIVMGYYHLSNLVTFPLVLVCNVGMYVCFKKCLFVYTAFQPYTCPDYCAHFIHVFLRTYI